MKRTGKQIRVTLKLAATNTSYIIPWVANQFFQITMWNNFIGTTEFFLILLDTIKLILLTILRIHFERSKLIFWCAISAERPIIYGWESLQGQNIGTADREGIKVIFYGTLQATFILTLLSLMRLPLSDWKSDENSQKARGFSKILSHWNLIFQKFSKWS